MLTSFTIFAKDQYGNEPFEIEHIAITAVGSSTVTLDSTTIYGSVQYSTDMSGTHFFHICAGDGSGLLAKYFLDDELKNGLFEQLDAEVNFDWVLGRPGSSLIPGDVTAGAGFGIRWSGYVTPYLSQIHTFSLEMSEADERVKLWIDEQLLIDQWASLSATAPTGTILACGGAAY